MFRLLHLTCHYLTGDHLTSDRPTSNRDLAPHCSNFFRSYRYRTRRFLDPPYLGAA